MVSILTVASAWHIDVGVGDYRPGAFCDDIHYHAVGLFHLNEFQIGHMPNCYHLFDLCHSLVDDRNLADES
jgi:hypothetical protein